MHLKNFSLIDQGAYNLAPAYDLLNVNIVLPSDKEESALPINGKKANLKRSDFETLAVSYGIEEEQYGKIFEMPQARIGEMLDMIDMSFLDEENKSRYKNLVTERIERLKS